MIGLQPKRSRSVQRRQLITERARLEAIDRAKSELSNVSTDSLQRIVGYADGACTKSELTSLERTHASCTADIAAARQLLQSRPPCPYHPNFNTRTLGSLTNG